MKKLLKLTLTLLILNTLYLIPSNAQVGINNDDSDPDESAMLDVKSSNKGVLVPRMSSTDRQQILDPAVGLMVYDSTAQAFYYFNGMGWLELLSNSVTLLEDSDGDTKIQVEESIDEDVIRFDVAGVESMVINSDQKVGIGTTTPLTKLHVVDEAVNFAWTPFGGTSTILERPSSNIVSIVTGNSGLSSLVMSDQDAQFRGRLRYEHTDDRMELWTANSEKVSILGNGNVGIGEPDPTTTLHVNGNLKIVDGNQQDGYVFTSDADGAGSWQTLALLQDSDSDTKIQVEESADEDAIRLDVFNTEAVRVEFDFSSASSINVNTIPSFTSLTTFNTGQPDWQSFTATATAEIDSLRMWMQNGNFTGISTYNFNIYKGEGTSGVLLTSTSASPNPTEGEIRGIPVTDEVILEKDSIYTISFDKRNGLGYKGGNLYAEGQSGFSSNDDYVLEVYAFAASPNTTINGTLNVTGSEATVTADAFIGDGSALTNLPSQVPIGTIIMWPSETLPAGWIPCNGQPFVRNTYPELFDLMGDTGDGTANVPNFRGRFPLGVGSSQTTYSTNHTIKSTGGFEKHKLTENEMPVHNHGAGSLTTQFPYKTRTDTGVQRNKDGSDENFFDSSAITGSTANEGGGVEHNNMPPFYTINFIIKAE